MSAYSGSKGWRLASAGVAVAVAALLVAGCSSVNLRKTNNDYSPRVVKKGQPVPAGGGAFKVGKAYTIRGVTYKPAHQPRYDKVGMASWYGSDFHGRKTANGEVYNMNAFSAAHPTLPLPTYARVTNLENGRSVVVRINDRGPFARGRIIDLSKRAAETLDFTRAGTAKVRVQYVGRAPLDGQDQWLTTTVREDGTNRRVAKLDKEMAARAFASDGVRGANEQNYQMAASTYRRGRAPRPAPEPVSAPDPAPMIAAAPQTPAPQPIAYQPVQAPPVVQAGVFSNFDNARVLADRLVNTGNVAVTGHPSDIGTLYRVTVVPRDGAQSLDDVLYAVRATGAPDAIVAGVY